jgi:hypothetical protein
MPASRQGGDAMAIVDRIKAICLKPKDEWQVIAGETSTTTDLLKNYALPLAAIGAIVGFLIRALIGYHVGLGLVSSIVGLAGQLAIVYVLAIIINELAPKFGAEKNLAQALKVAVYSFTPAWVAAVFMIVPVLGLLIMFAGACYAIYILYLGLPALMKSPQDKAPIYTIVVVVIGVVISWIVGAVVGAIAMAGTVATVTLPVVR